MRTARSLAATVSAVVILTSMSACTQADPPLPTPVAEQFADDMSALDLTSAPVNGMTGEAAQVRLDSIISGLGDAQLDAELVSVSEPVDDQATATYSYTWTLPGFTVPWTYEVTGQLGLHTEDGEDAQWRVDWTPTLVHPELVTAEELSISVSEQRTGRADILGEAGAVLVTERPVLRVGIDKNSVADAPDPVAATDAQAAQLAEAFDMDPVTYVERVNANGPKAFVELITVRDDGSYASQLQACQEIQACLAISDTRSLAPTREFARPILGTTGEATAEIIENSAGTIGVGDIVGLSGLQREYDSLLRPQPRSAVVATPTSGDPHELFVQEAAPPTPVATTLDPTLQSKAEGILSTVGPASAIVAIRPSDGHVLTAAVGPGAEGYNASMLGQYAPGSTFKVITALAMLRDGFTPESIVQCPTTLDVDGRSFTNFPGYPEAALGDVTLATAFANSCNTAFIGQSGTVTQQDLVDAGAALGVGSNVVSDIGFDSFLGSIPTDSTGTEHAASMIGQGKVLMSPLAMATVAASVAKGAQVTPMLIVDPATDPQVTPPAVPLTSAESATLQSLMRGVVTEGGATFLAPLEPPVMAKTGTAQFGTADPPETHTWMIAIQGDLAVAVFVEVGVSGAQTAGPLLEQFLTN